MWTARNWDSWTGSLWSCAHWFYGWWARTSLAIAIVKWEQGITINFVTKAFPLQNGMKSNLLQRNVMFSHNYPFDCNIWTVAHIYVRCSHSTHSLPQWFICNLCVVSIALPFVYLFKETLHSTQRRFANNSNLGKCFAVSTFRHSYENWSKLCIASNKWSPLKEIKIICSVLNVAGWQYHWIAEQCKAQ